MIAAIVMRERKRVPTTHIPPIDPAFVSDALNLEPEPGAEEIAELWCDRHAPEGMTTEQFQKSVERVKEQVAYYMPESGEAA